MTVWQCGPHADQFMCVAPGFHFPYKSTVKRVEHALNTPARTHQTPRASRQRRWPRRPGGKRYCTSIGNDPGQRRNRVPVRPNHSRQLGNLAASRQGETHHARDDEQINRGQLEKRGKDAPAAGYRFRWGRQRALHDILVRTPVPQPMIGAQNNMPSQGKLSLEYKPVHNMPRGICFRSTGDHVPCTPAGISGFHRLNMSEPHQWRSSLHPPN